MPARYSRALLHSQLGLWKPAPRPSFLCRCPRRADLDLLIAPQLGRQVLEYALVNGKVATLGLLVSLGLFTVISTYGPNGHTEYPAYLDSPGGVLDDAPTGACIVLLGDSKPMWATTVSGGLSLHFCASHSLSTTKTGQSKRCLLR